MHIQPDWRKRKKNIGRDQVQEVIPEKLERAWDIGQTGENIQVVAVQNKLFSLLEKVLAEEKLAVEAAETEAVSISRLIGKKKEKKTFLFLKIGENFILGAVKNEVVVFTQVFAEFPGKKEFETFFDYVRQRHGQIKGKIYTDAEPAIFAEKKINMEAEKMEIEPLLGLRLKRDLRGRDRKVLNIIFEKKGGSERSKEAGILTWRGMIIAIVFLAVVSAGAAAVYYLQKKKAETKKIIAPSGAQNSQAGLKWEK